MDTTINNSEKIELSHVLFHSKFVSCLTCKRFIGHNATNRKSDALTHVKGKSHRKIVKSLFRNFINDPFCISNDVKYLDVLKNLKLDISRLVQSSTETTYIHEINERLFCSVCQETVSNSNNVDQIKTDLVHHLNVKIESHVSIMKDSVSWIYNLKSANGFISFHKAKVYCSVCDINLDFVEDLMLHAAVGHLQTKQHKLKLFKLDVQNVIVRAQGSEGHGLSALPRRVNIEDSQIVQQFVNSHVNIDKMTLDSIRNLAQDPIFALHVQFLRIDGGNFICSLCDVPLTISRSKNDHLKMHILGSPHRKLSIERQIFLPDPSKLRLTDEIKLIGTTPHDQIQKLALEPKFAPHVKYLQVKGKICSCLLCDVSLSVSIKVNHNLKDHLLGGRHARRFENRHPVLVEESLKVVREAKSSSPIEQMESMALAPHLNDIDKSGNHYRCLICNVPVQSEHHLKEHLLGEKHRKQAKKSTPLNEQCSSQNISQFKKLAQNPACAPHIKYLNVIGKQCQCSICGVAIPSSYKNVRMHILGAKHTKCLAKLQPDIIQRQLSINGQHVAPPSQIKTLTQDPRCAPHLPYLQVKDKTCYCSVCCVSIPMEKTGFMQHILGAKHMKRFEKLQPGDAQVHKATNDRNIPSTLIPEIKKLAQDPRFAPHLQYFKKEKKQFRCSLCGVLVGINEHDVKMHILGVKHQKCFETTEKLKRISK